MCMSRAARRGRRRCSRGSCCYRTRSVTRTWPNAGGVSPLSSGDDTPATEVAPPATDERRSSIVGRVKAKLGEAVVASEVLPERDIWVRVARDAWAETARVLGEDLGFTNHARRLRP